VDDVLADGARGVFMLMYELVHSAGMGDWIGERDRSVAPTIDTMETEPESTAAISDDFIPITASDAIESESESTTPASPEPKPQILKGDTPTAETAAATIHTTRATDNPAAEPSMTDTTNSSLEIVAAQLGDVHISPPCSVTSNSTDDSLVHVEHQSTRSTSFSPIHSRPQTPIFEKKDPQLSPPPLKRIKREEEGEVGDFSMDSHS
jgi:hypothetical protein